MLDLSSIILDWIAPSGIVIVVGFIIWLVQLNHWVMELKKESGATSAKVDKLDEALKELINNNVKISTILEYMSEDVKENKQELSELRKDIHKMYKA